MKKLLSLALALALCLGLTVPAAAEHNVSTVGPHSTFGSGVGFSAIIDAGGSLWMQGDNTNGQLGTGDTEYQWDFVKVMDGVVAVSCGYAPFDTDGNCTAAVKADGSLWMWGSNSNGQLGNGRVGNAKDDVSGYPIQTVPVKVMDGVAAVSCGEYYTAAVKTDGSLWMWGDNYYGELGNGRYGADQIVPVKVMDGVAAVGCGSGFTAAIKTDGSLWMWGNSTFGQLGNGGVGNARYTWDEHFHPYFSGDFILQTVPVKVMDDVAAVDCGMDFTAAIKTDGSLWMWGGNDLGQLGNGNGGFGDYQTTPMKVMDDVKQVSSYADAVAAVRTDGSLWMWGSLLWAEQARWLDSTVETSEGCSNVPVEVKKIDDVVAVSARPIYAIKPDGSVVKDEDEYPLPDGFIAMLPYGIVSQPQQPPQPQQPQQPQQPAISFTDVEESAYFAAAVQWTVAQKITSGTGDGTTFSPGAICSTAQILTFLWRANGSPEPTAANPFTDIKPDNYYYKAALWAAEKGLVSGSTFGASTDCTRAMTVEYLWKAAGSPAPTIKADFVDVPADADYASAVAWAVENKITSGTSNEEFSPDLTCTRGQIVTFLHRAMGK